MNDIDLLTAARPDVDKLDRADKQRLYSAITNHSSISTEDPADQTPFQLIPVVWVCQGGFRGWLQRKRMKGCGHVGGFEASLDAGTITVDDEA